MFAASLFFFPWKPLQAFELCSVTAETSSSLLVFGDASRNERKCKMPSSAVAYLLKKTQYIYYTSSAPFHLYDKKLNISYNKHTFILYILS